MANPRNATVNFEVPVYSWYCNEIRTSILTRH